MRLIHDEKSALDNSPLFLDLCVGGGKALACYLLSLSDYLICLLLNVCKDCLRLLISLFHIFKICIDSELGGFKQAADLCGGLGKASALAYLYLISVKLCLKLLDLRFKLLYSPAPDRA